MELPNEAIERAICYRAKGLVEESIALLESLDPKSDRRNIHLAMSYCSCKNSKLALSTVKRIPAGKVPTYLVESIFALLHSQGDFRDLMTILDLRTYKYLQDIFLLIRTQNNYAGVAGLTAIYQGLSQESRRRLQQVFCNQLEFFLVRCFYHRIDLKQQDRKRFLNYALQTDLNIDGALFSDLLAIDCCVNQIEPDKKISDELMDCSKVVAEARSHSADDIRLLDAAGFLQSVRPKEIRALYLKIVSQWTLFPVVTCGDKVANLRAATYFYRHFHYLGRILGPDVADFVEKERQSNSPWYGQSFVAGCFEYCRGNYDLAQTYIASCEKMIRDAGMPPNMIASLGHMASALCWEPTFLLREYPAFVDFCLGPTDQEMNVSDDLCYVLGADPIYANNFLDLFIKILSQKNKSSGKKTLPLVFLTVYTATENLAFNSEQLSRYSAGIQEEAVLRTRFVDEDFLRRHSLGSTSHRGIYPLLRYLSLYNLMEANKEVAVFLICDIDCHPLYSSGFIADMASEYDVILSAVASTRDYGVPSYIGAGCLAVRNNEIGRKFVTDVLTTIRHSLGKQVIDAWNLDQAAIRSAVTANGNIRYGYFPVLGSVLKFANAYASKEDFASATARDYGVAITNIGLI